ncbi:MAG: hypothetical protein ABSB35_24375 [Bryobacteraceae bacterium]|jgi:hypothetical protein
MLISLKKRICNLEKSIRLPLTAEQFLTDAVQYAQRTGTGFDITLQSLSASVTDDDLDRLIRELEGIVFRGDTVARDAARHRASTMAGNAHLFVSATSELSSLDNESNW